MYRRYWRFGFGGHASVKPHVNWRRTGTASSNAFSSSWRGDNAGVERAGFLGTMEITRPRRDFDHIHILLLHPAFSA